MARATILYLIGAFAALFIPRKDCLYFKRQSFGGQVLSILQFKGLVRIMSGMISDGHRSWHSMAIDKDDGQTMLTDGISGGNFPLSFDEAQFLHQALTEYLSMGEKAINAICSMAYTEYNNRQYERIVKPAKPKQVKPGFVYLIQSPSGYFKIGYSSTPEDRLKTFGTLLPLEVEYTCLIQTGDMRKLEKELHQKFASQRINGEWFALSPADVEYIKGLAK